MGAESFCDNVYYAYPVRIFGPEIGISMLALGLVFWGMNLLVVYFMKRQEHYAKQGNDEAVKSVIFPVFVPVLWANTVLNILSGFVAMITTFHPNKGILPAWLLSLLWGAQHTVLEGVALLLMEKGLGYHSAKQVLKKAGSWGIFTFLLQISIKFNDPPLSTFLEFLWQSCLIIFYGVLFFTPEQLLFRRPATYFYARMWMLFRSFELIITLLYAGQGLTATANCFDVFGTLFPFAVFEPLLLYFTLLQDSRWWQGLDLYGFGSLWRRTPVDGNIKAPLEGLDLNLGSAQTLAASLDTMGAVEGQSGAANTAGANKERGKIEGNVKLLNFACISLDHTKLLGSGSFSKVYQGSYRQQQCAIKLIFTIDLTTEVIQRIAAEAQILSSIRHPHVVDILGVSVLPPSVCILLELCTFGSLGDVLKGAAKPPLGSLRLPTDLRRLAPAAEASMLTYLHGYSQDTNIDKSTTPASQLMDRDALSISWTDRLYLAVGCARGLAALHSYSPHFCHRDIKSFNFLVDQQLNAKISDLELGLADEIQASTQDIDVLKTLTVARSSVRGSDSRERTSKKLSSDRLSLSLAARMSEMAKLSLRKTESRVKIDILANWLAPEVVEFGPDHYYQASDVYSFALVLWEILTGSQPFQDVPDQNTICKNILRGVRPDVPPAFVEESEYKSIFSPYIKLFSQGWSQRARDRPQIHNILEQLEQMWRDSCHSNFYSTDVMPTVEEIFNDPSVQCPPLLNPSSTSVTTPNDEENQIKTPAEQKKRNSSQQPFYKNLFKKRSMHSFINPASSHEMPKSHVDALIAALSQESKALNNLEKTGGSWMLVHPYPPHVVLWVSVSWTLQTNVPMSSVVGKNLRTLPIFLKTHVKDQKSSKINNVTKNITDLIFTSATRKKEILQQKQADDFCNSLKTLEIEKDKNQPGITHSGSHHVLTLYEGSQKSQKPNKKDKNTLPARISMSFSQSSNSAQTQTEALYSIHVFPIYRKTPSATRTQTNETGNKQLWPFKRTSATRDSAADKEGRQSFLEGILPFKQTRNSSISSLNEKEKESFSPPGNPTIHLINNTNNINLSKNHSSAGIQEAIGAEIVEQKSQTPDPDPNYPNPNSQKEITLLSILFSRLKHTEDKNKGNPLSKASSYTSVLFHSQSHSKSMHLEGAVDPDRPSQQSLDVEEGGKHPVGLSLSLRERESASTTDTGTGNNSRLDGRTVVDSLLHAVKMGEERRDSGVLKRFNAAETGLEALHEEKGESFGTSDVDTKREESVGDVKNPLFLDDQINK